MQIQFGLVMFEDVACLIYDLQDARRLYDVYLQNLRLINLPKMKAQNEDKSAMGNAFSNACLSKGEHIFFRFML